MSFFLPTQPARAHEARSVEQLSTAIRGGDQPDWLLFWGHRAEPDGLIGSSCLSQWYPAAFTVEAITYPSAEHFMMAAKARVFQDADTEALILDASTAGEAKRLGRRVRGFKEIVWSRHRETAVFVGNLAKFHQNPALGDFLAATGSRVLVEASPYDRIWGIGLRACGPADAPGRTSHDRSRPTAVRPTEASRGRPPAVRADAGLPDSGRAIRSFGLAVLGR